MALIDQHNLAGDWAFGQRVRAAILTAALNVIAEVATTPNHATRKTYAQQVIAGLDAAVAKMLPAVATNATLMASYLSTAPPAAANTLDSDIQFTVNSIWEAFAGV